jgi:hypothetical protein
MYLKYLKERENMDAIQTQHGLVLYKIEGSLVLIADIYIKPEVRGAKKSFTLADIVLARAKAKGCTGAVCQVDTSAGGVSQSIAIILKYGFVPSGADGGLVFFTKEV